MAAWNIRIRSSSGQATLSLPEAADSTFAALQALIHSTTGIAPDQQEILAGWPPRPVQVRRPAAICVGFAASVGCQQDAIFVC